MLERGRRVFTFAAIFFALSAILRIGLGIRGDASREKRKRVDGPSSIAASRQRMQEAIRGRDATAYAAYFSTDSMCITPAGATIHGNGALLDATRNSFEDARVIEAGIETSDVRAVDGSFVEEGHFWLDLERQTGSVRSAGRFTAVWKRERDEWKIVFETARAL